MTQSFMLTNKTGGYTLLSPSPQSKYEGFNLFFGSEMFKVIANIRHAEDIKSTKDNHWNIQRFYDDFSERFFMPHSYNSLVYQIDTDKEFDVLLDVKKAYDNREWGRNYTIDKTKDLTVVTFTKTTSNHEDDSDGQVEYRAFLAIKGAHSTINDTWEEERYPYDESRNQRPFSRHIYNALKLKGKKIVFSFGFDRAKTEAEAKHVFNRLGAIMEKQHHYTDKLLYESHLSIHEEDRKRAYEASVVALDSLTAQIDGSEGLFAGLPWFFQFWTRDEAISLLAMMQIGKLKRSEKIIFRQLKELKHDGRIPNRFPSANLASADGTGWAFKRTGDFLSLIKKRHIFKRFMSIGLRKKIIQALDSSIYHQMKYFSEDGLIKNRPKETWMDTDFGGDTREGFRVEIQALYLSMLKLRYRLTGFRKHLDEELAYKGKVREALVRNSVLLDGKDDKTFRPNVFIAYYLYPDLLAKKEWEKTFDRTLSRVWLEWGGVASIDKTDDRFVAEYTADQDKSYHRGDSWYWVNNMVAICLHRLNEEKYEDKVERIIDASTRDILFQGVEGYHAEVSSARAQTSSGCLCQAWSSALYLELIRETYGK